MRVRFDRKARFVMAAAYEAALESRDESVHVEHLVLGFQKAAPELLPDGLAADVLRRRVAARLDRAGSPENGPRQVKDRSAEVRAVVQRAEDMAVARGCPRVEARDLFEALRESGGDILRALLEEEEARPVGVGPRPERERHGAKVDLTGVISVSDEADSPYFAQIAGCIREAVAAGELIAGDRLPSIRELAQALDLAPGTVSRAYKRLEAEGVVVTAGALGTMIGAPGTPDLAAEELVGRLVDMLRPVAVTAYHLGASPEDLCRALRLTLRSLALGESNG